MSSIFIVFAVSMAWGTFIEKVYSTETARALIYESSCLEFLMILLIFCFIGNIKKYCLWKKEKLPLLVFHSAFILIFMGGAISRYIGFEGVIPLQKGFISRNIISNKTYIKLCISQVNKIRIYQSPYILATLHKKYFVKFLFKGEILRLRLINYIPNAKAVFNENPKGSKILKIFVIKKGKEIERFILAGKIKRLNNLTQISFDKSFKGAIEIFEHSGKLFIFSKKMGITPQKMLSELQMNALYNFYKFNIVISENVRKGILKYETIRKNITDLLKVEISTKGHSKIIEFLGGRGKTKMGVRTSFNGKKISIGYGGIIFKLPFGIKLRTFELEKYPGSESPSSFSSKITIFDKERKEDHKIFMNNVLDYRKYRFFQSTYNLYKKRVVLSVNHDIWGRRISYFSYFLLVFGMFISLFWSGSRFRKLSNTLKT
jgi:hypothetical protein